MAAVLLVTAACGDDGDSATPPPPTTGSTDGSETPARVEVFPTTSTTSGRAVPSRFEFVDYVVVGGIAGVNDQLKVFPDGRATYQDGNRLVNFDVPARTVEELRAALERADLASLPPVDTTRPGSADLLTYRIIYGGRSVRFHDGTMPPALGPAVTILNAEMARAKAMR